MPFGKGTYTKPGRPAKKHTAESMAMDMLARNQKVAKKIVPVGRALSKATKSK